MHKRISQKKIRNFGKFKIFRQPYPGPKKVKDSHLKGNLLGLPTCLRPALISSKALVFNKRALTLASG